MAEPDPEDDWLVVESFARWAGDTALARETLSKAQTATRERIRGPREPKSSRVPNVLVEWAKTRSEREKPTARDRQMEGTIGIPEPVERQPEERKPKSPFIQSPNLRAVVSIVTTREFELRGYPTNLNVVERLLRNAAIAQKDFASAGRVEGYGDSPSELGNAERAAGAAWVMTGTPLRFCWVDAFGLILVRGIWTAPEPVVRLGEVYNSFREVLNVLDPK